MSELRSLVSGGSYNTRRRLAEHLMDTCGHQKPIKGRSVCLYYRNGHGMAIPLVLGKPVNKVRCHVELNIILNLP